MIITRKTPNTHQLAGITFHPGSQFIRDAQYHSRLKNNSDFKAQIKRGLMVVDVPALPSNTTSSKKNLAEAIAELPEDKAIVIVSQTVDAIDLKEIVKHDKRRKVVETAERQLDERQVFMNSMAPRMPLSSGEPISLGEHE